MMRAAHKAGSRILLAFALLGAMAIPAAAEEDCTGFSFPVIWSWPGWRRRTAKLSRRARSCRPGRQGVFAQVEIDAGRYASGEPGKKKQAIGAATYSGGSSSRACRRAGSIRFRFRMKAGSTPPEWRGGAMGAFTGRPACKAVRKSVRFELGAGPLIVQISGAPVETVKVAIREAN